MIVINNKDKKCVGNIIVLLLNKKKIFIYTLVILKAKPIKQLIFVVD